MPCNTSMHVCLLDSLVCPTGLYYVALSSSVPLFLTPNRSISSEDISTQIHDGFSRVNTENEWHLKH